MTKDISMGKRYPRGLHRRRNAKDGKNLTCSYYDLGRVPLNADENEYKKKLSEFKKMANVS